MNPTNSHPSIAIVTPIFNRISGLQRFFDSVGRITYPNYTLVIVDDGSTDGSEEYIREHNPRAVLLKGDGNLWWAGSTNMGIEWAQQHDFDYVLTYNDDQICDPEFLTKLIAGTQQYTRAILASHVYYLNDPKRLVSGGIRIDQRTRHTYGVNNEEVIYALMPPYEVDCVPGYAVLIPMEVIREAGPFDNKRFPQTHMELEFCLRIKVHGFRIVVIPDSIIWNDRDDKCEDPIKFKNIFKRLKWFFTSPKSSLNYKQNEHLINVLFEDITIMNFKYYCSCWLKYYIKLIASSLFPIEKRKYIKSKMRFINKDHWA